MGILSWLIVGAIAGWLAGLLVRGDEGLGVVGHIVLGIIGALIGGFLAGVVLGGDYVTGVNVTTLVVAVIGAVILVVVWDALTGRTRVGRGPVWGRRRAAVPRVDFDALVAPRQHPVRPPTGCPS